MITAKKIMREMRVGKKIYCMNPYSNGNPEKVQIKCLTIISRVDPTGLFRHVDKHNYHSHSYIQDNFLKPKFIGFTYQAAKRALARYKASKEQQDMVRKHHNKCWDIYHD